MHSTIDSQVRLPISEKRKKYLIIILGPTAVGKTSLSIQLAKHFNTSIVSADSRQFYQEISIGTAKPTVMEMDGVTHYLINSISIHHEYNVGKYESDAMSIIQSLFKEKNLVILVGGSGLYIDAITKGFDELPEANQEVRERIKAIHNESGIEGLQSLLKELDSEYYSKVDLQNPQRMSRALEVCLTTGKTYTSFRKGTITNRAFEIIKIGVNTSREALYERINLRVDEMMKQGLLEEVKQVEPFKHLNSLQTVGYKELFDFLEGKIELTSAVDLIKQNTRRYAKRQLTWFRKDETITWFEPTEKEEIVKHINQKRTE